MYPLAVDTLGADEIAAAKAVLDSGRLTMGERVAAFEREFADYVGSEHAVMVNSGSSANLIMVDAMLRRSRGAVPLRRGDEVLVPALAWPTTVWPLIQLGLVPVFVDVDRETLAIDLRSAAEAISPATRAMFLIHVLGRAADMGAVQSFCDEHKLYLLEDACESLGASHESRSVGTFGLMGSFSLYFSHHLSTIEGGVVVTDDQFIADELRSLRAHGWVRDRSDRDYWALRSPKLDDRFLFVTSGYNVRPTEIQAAIGSVQLRRLPDMLRARWALAELVQARIERAAPWLELIGADCLGRERASHSWMMLPFRITNGRSLVTVKQCFEDLGVATRPIIAGNFVRHPAVRRLQFPAEYRCAPSLSGADDLLNGAFMIGCHPAASSETIGVLLMAFEQLG